MPPQATRTGFQLYTTDMKPRLLTSRHVTQTPTHHVCSHLPPPSPTGLYLDDEPKPRALLRGSFSFFRRTCKQCGMTRHTNYSVYVRGNGNEDVLMGSNTGLQWVGELRRLQHSARGGRTGAVASMSPASPRRSTKHAVPSIKQDPAHALLRRGSLHYLN